MVIIPLNEQGYPIKKDRYFPNWLIVAHVALVGASVIAMLVLGAS
tara:strand:+ start:1978 stop:2112 length:135 start_codon:yes stop_codon:yes gene_type:complete